ncbi:unnamed protein product, partial [Ixodes pacificus]
MKAIIEYCACFPGTNAPVERAEHGMNCREDAASSDSTQGSSDAKHAARILI